MSETRQIHTLEPFYDRNSRLLILGSFPSVKSREESFYYAHKQNRFWTVLAELYGEEKPEGVEKKKEFLHRHRIALWDVIASCEITGSDDSSIRNEQVNDLSVILKEADIRFIYVNGRKAERLYEKKLAERFGKAEYLPSTSPANASLSLADLKKKWEKILREE